MVLRVIMMNLKNQKRVGVGRYRILGLNRHYHDIIRHKALGMKEDLIQYAAQLDQACYENANCRVTAWGAVLTAHVLTAHPDLRIILVWISIVDPLSCNSPLNSKVDYRSAGWGAAFNAYLGHRKEEVITNYAALVQVRVCKDPKHQVGARGADPAVYPIRTIDHAAPVWAHTQNVFTIGSLCNRRET
ncbi:uncharacterized protein LACBIDRAFT_328247 [Laccaria bicolor S238N-H82]|uniref:Predicted protein n=1 Tax=Laccaria bicolor (strain S238N-H82 / ATCC MYA-4686) TaxID=486041 RepID=B0DEB2_LACBS|nr:uncharacterized protein LACBIDRAFT_328247 [Laccaria bicolor S238N-H82]EDR06900.1 predicted protein [Laccaria bicolor S238N-H82]|eukprot:XP_001882273.1 predicted protein [Laccaria bicolor S238N-H82]